MDIDSFRHRGFARGDRTIGVDASVNSGAIDRTTESITNKNTIDLESVRILESAGVDRCKAINPG